MKTSPQIAIIYQKYIVSEVELISTANLTEESERHR